jgi:hypothetical protein
LCLVSGSPTFDDSIISVVCNVFLCFIVTCSPR